VSDANEPYPFESDDDIEIRELDLESVDTFGDERITVGELAGESESWRYGHVIVDEAQDLTAMQWRMIMRRVRGRAMTIVGDLAQRSASTVQRWDEVLPSELATIRRQDLTVNYRSPAEIHELAVQVLADFAPSITPSTAIRESGVAPSFVRVAAIDQSLDTHLDQMLDAVGGQVAVIGVHGQAVVSRHVDDEDGRVRFLTPIQSKGLEFDAVVLVEPSLVLAEPGGAAQLYIALTRATQRLLVLHTADLPAVLSG